MPTLYIVSTPIGNLEDITLRAIRILREVDLIAAEDTRVTRKLLTRYKISTRVESYNEHNKNRKTPNLIHALSYGNVALVSDAGTPVINDPGAYLISEAVRSGVTISPVPGPSSITAALALSNFGIEQFTYVGFLPRKKSERQTTLKSLSITSHTLLIFEAPHRLKSSLIDIYTILGDRQIIVCREMTKLNEEIFRGTVKQAINHFTQPRGEFTLLIREVHKQKTIPFDQGEVARSLLSKLHTDGAHAKDAVAKVSESTGFSKRSVYEMWIETKNRHKNDNN